jgi:starch-binding outer membrane protein SusE/F
MKHIVNYIIYVLVIGLCLSCEKDVVKPIISEDGNAASFTNLSSGTVLVITPEAMGDNINFEWKESDYGLNTEVSYKLEADLAENNFSASVSLGETFGRTLTVSISDLNNKLLNELHAPANQPSVVNFRIVSSITGDYVKTSSPVEWTITPYEPLGPQVPATLWVPGGYQGWNPGAAPVIYAVGEGKFEGYVYIQEGTGFKFTSAPDWNHTNFGDAGTPGALTKDGLANGLSASEPGYYRFKVDTLALTYEMYRVDKFGIIGTATSGGWDTSTDMEYSSESDEWSVTTYLTEGALKFRANNDWAVNYGPMNSNTLNGELIETNDAISITIPGNYIVKISFNRSAYPYAYTYNVAPAKLWVPGAYQGWSPATAPNIYSVGDGNYEGYVYMNSAGNFKFTSAPDWNHLNYGNGGVNQLTTDGLAGDLSVASAGYYRFKVDTDNLTWENYLVESFGLIGSATAGGWDNSTPMTFDPTTGLWSTTVDLVGGALKFRANNSWDVNYGPLDSNALSGELISTDASITISEGGNYTVVIDMSKSGPEAKYTYTVTKN